MITAMKVSLIFLVSFMYISFDYKMLICCKIYIIDSIQRTAMTKPCKYKHSCILVEINVLCTYLQTTEFVDFLFPIARPGRVPLDYASAGQIRDDDIFKTLIGPMPGGVTLTSIMDCCHSGTVLDLPYVFVADGTQEEMSMPEDFDFQKLEMLYSLFKAAASNGDLIAMVMKQCGGCNILQAVHVYDSDAQFCLCACAFPQI